LIICVTMGGNTPDFLSGSEMVSPPAMLARDSMTASWTTRLPDVLAVISRPSRIATPDDTSVPSVRVNRAMAALRWSGPTIGMRRMILSMTSWPCGVL
jgi:hypothetical protein